VVVRFWFLCTGCGGDGINGFATEMEEEGVVEAISLVVFVVVWLLVMVNGFPDLQYDLAGSSDWHSSSSEGPELRPAFPERTFFRNGMADDDDAD